MTVIEDSIAAPEARIQSPEIPLEAEVILNAVLAPVDPTEFAPVKRNRYNQAEKEYEARIREAFHRASYVYDNAAPRAFESVSGAVERLAFVDDEVKDKQRQRVDSFITESQAVSHGTWSESKRFTDEHADEIVELADVLATDYRRKAEQIHYYRRLEDYVEQAHTANDMLAITEAYVFMRANSHTSDGATLKSYVYFMKKMFERAGTLAADPYDGGADPEAIADMLESSIEFFINHPDMAELYEDSGYGAGIDSFMSQQLLSQAGATAEGVAALRIRERLAKAGHENFKHTKAAKEHDHRTSERYITNETLAVVTKNIYGTEHQALPEGADALATSVKVITDTVQRLANSGDYPIAQQIAGAIDKLRHSREDSLLKILPYSSIIHLGNLLGKQLNQQGNLSADERLEDLDTNSLLQLPAAFQRILYAIEPSLLQEAVTGDITETNDIRARMVFLEALAVQWQERQKRFTMTVGDVVMRLSAYGMDEAKIARTINGLKEEAREQKGRYTSSGIAVRSLKKYTDDWRTRSGRVTSRKRKPGYGAIS